MILAQICDELLCGKAEFPKILGQNGQNDLEGQSQWPLFSIPAESKSGSMFAANLVIPAQICDELTRGQGEVHGRTDRQMDRRRQRQYPFGLKGQGVKNGHTITCIWRRGRHAFNYIHICRQSRKYCTTMNHFHHAIWRYIYKTKGSIPQKTSLNQY